MNWFKKLFGIGDKMQTDVNGLPVARNLTPMPKVKPCKADKDISEPVFAMLKAWKEDPKSFKLSFESVDFNSLSFYKSPTVKLSVWDSCNREEFIFGLALESKSWVEIGHMYHSTPWFGEHKIYPVLGCRVSYKPSWMTQDELDFIVKTVTPYYSKRVNRYRDIVESRIDRSRKAIELKSEIAKQKERDRLTGVYK